MHLSATLLKEFTRNFEYGEKKAVVNCCHTTCDITGIISKLHTHPFSGPMSGTTRMSRHQKGKTNLDFVEARE